MASKALNDALMEYRGGSIPDPVDPDALVAFGRGAGQGYKEQAKGLLEMVLHPIATGQAVATAAGEFLDNPVEVLKKALGGEKERLAAALQDPELGGKYLSEWVSPVPKGAAGIKRDITIGPQGAKRVQGAGRGDELIDAGTMDGVPFKELEDNYRTAQFPRPGIVGRLDSVIPRDDPIFIAYPSLRGTGVKLKPSETGLGGTFADPTPDFPGGVLELEFKAGAALDLDTLRGTLAHELSHAAAAAEGLPREFLGGDPRVRGLIPYLKNQGEKNARVDSFRMNWSRSEREDFPVNQHVGAEDARVNYAANKYGNPFELQDEMQDMADAERFLRLRPEVSERAQQFASAPNWQAGAGSLTRNGPRPKTGTKVQRVYMDPTSFGIAAGREVSPNKVDIAGMPSALMKGEPVAPLYLSVQNFEKLNNRVYVNDSDGAARAAAVRYVYGPNARIPVDVEIPDGFKINSDTLFTPRGDRRRK